ncbi:MAG: tRNA 4-thiouridine(8) synthase ThiI, partial [Oscillospiraceae bacterium]|nr:tRNA 4-thiouridine(8) synthase ThiI [Oscillospiraceae bacterium]
IAEEIARRNDCIALISGESLGQVASQTMMALARTDAVAGMPVLRPLIGMDKEEIIRIARKIDTYELSILPFEDCCTVFTPRHPRTRPTARQVDEAESGLSMDDLMEEAIENARKIWIAPNRK